MAEIRPSPQHIPWWTWLGIAFVGLVMVLFLIGALRDIQFPAEDTAPNVQQAPRR